MSPVWTTSEHKKSVPREIHWAYRGLAPSYYNALSTSHTLLCHSEVSARSVAQARRAFLERQSSSQPSAVQNWENDYATDTFKTAANGLLSVDGTNEPGEL